MSAALAVVVAPSLHAYGAFSPWMVLLGLVLALVCLLVVVGVVALYEVVIATVLGARRTHRSRLITKRSGT